MDFRKNFSLKVTFFKSKITFSYGKLFAGLRTPKGLKYLIDLYSTRMHYEWKMPENLQWLEKNVQHIISNEKSFESKVNEYKNKLINKKFFISLIKLFSNNFFFN